MNNIQQTILDALPYKRKQSSGGWISFNAVCCHNNGERQDTRGRGGVIFANEAVTYHCFNCGFKTGWQPGRHISFKLRKLLSWLDVDENTRQMLTIEALRIKETVDPVVNDEIIQIDFPPRTLPNDLHSIHKAPQEVQDYAATRCLPADKILWSSSDTAKMNKRIIVPFTWNGNVIGFSSRAINNSIVPKFFTSHEPGYVYGVDQQPDNRKFAIVVEGLLDAVCIDGVATLTNRCSETQAQIIDSLAREIILVPDRDNSGQKLIADALKYGWSVSFPEWQSDIKDVNDAVQRYGKLFTIKTIIDARQTNSLKINLLRKKWYD